MSRERSPLHIVGNGRSKYLDPRWQKKRLEIMERDEWTCQSCASSSKTLNVHHLYYSKTSAGPWDYEQDALITYCQDCHESIHASIKRHANGVFKSLLNAGIQSEEQVEEFVDFLELVRCGSRDARDRAAAMDYLLNYWTQNGAFPQDEAL